MSARATNEKRGEKIEDQVIRSVRFDKRHSKIAHNASDVVVLGDSRFLFCDNNVNSALFELRPSSAGSLARPIVSHPIRGVRPEAIDDMECMTKAVVDGEHLLFISSSLSLQKNGKLRKKSRRGKLSAARESLLRMRVSPNGKPEAEIIPCFRAWLVENAPVLSKAAKRLPDEGGLNVEGLAWDPTQSMLLFGLRTPTKNGRPVVLRVQVGDPTGIWNLSNLQMSRPVTLAIKGEGEQGIRAITWDVSRKVFLVLVGNAISGKKTPFALYSWDGNTRGIVHKFEHVRFHKKMRPEGITHGTIGGRGVVLFVDDNGGYQFLWDTDPRLRREAATTVRAAARTVARGRAKATVRTRAVRARTVRVTRRASAARARARA